ncbi:ABC transporter permease [Miltoncostaea marina]|uniref:ABC transporter permease n=1 Tax=Miltoncostaea marina TaxID=2843215 RepID=UPI001C3DDA12|nr:ABC transporter permease [Miltoncostaea marina]
MFRLILRGLATRKLRTVLTSIAIVLGVAMVAGTFILTDQINRAFDEIFETGNEKVDAIVSRDTDFDTFEDQLPPLPASVIDDVRRVDGVRHAEGQISTSGQLVVGGDEIESQGGAPAIVVSNVDESINPSVVLEGRLPENPGEVAVIKSVADREDLQVGMDDVELGTKVGLQPVKLVGVFRYGDVESIGGATVVLITFGDAQRWFDREGETSQVLAAAEPGLTEAELATRIRAAMPADVKVETAAENAQAQSDEIGDEISGFLGPALLTFAGVALFVGAFIIFNTFSITVAQRVKEFGMMRTLGATRGQVMRSVIGEALLVGVVASLLGLVAGIGVAAGILAIFEAIGIGLPATGIRVAAGTVVTGLLVGVVVTVLASVGPALRATRVPPIAAVQEGATLPAGRFSKAAPYLAGLFLVGGILLFAYGLLSDLGATEALQALAAGAVLVFLGAGFLARFAVRPMARAIGAPIEALAGTTGRLARANATRNPARTASTAAALMIGVGLVSFVAIFAAGLKDSFTGAITRTIQGDLILQSSTFEPFPAAVEDAVRGVPGVRDAAFIRFPEIRTEPGGTQFLNAFDPEVGPRVLDFDWEGDASDALFDRLGTDGALIETNLARSTGLRTGDRFTVRTNRGRTQAFTVLGEYRDPVLFTGIVVSDEAANRLEVPPDPSVGVVSFEDGVDPAAGQAAVERRIETDFPSVDVQSNAEFTDQIEGQIDQILALLYALLAISLIISLFGIVNALILSIYERTREIGMLRAIGTTRRQMRAIVRYESMITAVIGAVLGIIIGVVFAWVLTRGLEDQGIEFSLPLGTLVLFLVLSIVAGVLAAVLPARRAARLNPLEALHEE